MVKVIQLAADITKFLQTSKTRPNFKKAEKKRNVTNTGGIRPYFGSIPDYSSNANGLALTGVSLNGPADKAGLKAKDVVTTINEYKIGGIEDFDSALRKFKAGDKVKVYVPSPLSAATGPPAGSQPHHGPVKRTSEPPVLPQTSVVMIKSD